MTTITFEELKQKYQSKLEKESEVACKLLTKIKDGYLVEINDEWEGFLHNNQMLSESEAELHSIGSLKALITSGPDKSDRYLVSPKALKERVVWGKLQKFFEEGTILKVTIAKVVKGGVEVYIDGVRAFLPGRYIKLPGISQDNWANQEIEVLIEELNYKEKNVILNQRKAYELEKQKKAEVAIQRLKEGDIVEASVLRIADFGVFVDLGGLDGLVPASELSWGRFVHPKDMYKVGQILTARIFRLEKDSQRVALSVKQVLGDPWEQLDNELSMGKEVSGKVISEAAFGTFVELRPGIEALIHNSEMPEGMDKPKLHSTITAKIIKIDLEQRKIGLSTRDLESKQVPVEQQETNNNYTYNKEEPVALVSCSTEIPAEGDALINIEENKLA